MVLCCCVAWAMCRLPRPHVKQWCWTVGAYGKLSQPCVLGMLELVGLPPCALWLGCACVSVQCLWDLHSTRLPTGLGMLDGRPTAHAARSGSA